MSLTETERLRTSATPKTFYALQTFQNKMLSNLIWQSGTPFPVLMMSHFVRVILIFVFFFSWRASDKSSDIYNMHASRDIVHTVHFFCIMYCLARIY